MIASDTAREIATSTALEVRCLCAWYGRSQALWDVDLTLRAGEGLGIIGRNGAGKSTLLRTIAGVHPFRTTGEVVLSAVPVGGRPAHVIARRGLSLVREGAPVFGSLSVLDNIRLGDALARRRGLEPEPLHEVWSMFPLLEPHAGRAAGLLSGGQRQMLAMATAIASRPSLLLLDEPSAGLAPEAAATTFEAIARLRATGLCVLISEQNVDWLHGITASFLQLQGGRVQDGAHVG
ncbi:MAG: ABC transporter ATP-binding protein [Acidimicrobiales bacterium]